MSGGWTGAGAAAISAGLGIGESYMNKEEQKDKIHSLESGSLAAQKQMVADWVRGYVLSQGEFDSARQDILAREKQGYGNVTAGMAGSGLLNTTAGANMARGVRMDTDRSLTDLASTRASSTYDKWLDLASIHSNEVGRDPEGMNLDLGERYRDMFDYAGVDWGNFLFGKTSQKGGNKPWERSWGPVGNVTKHD